ncbi:Mitochondrial import inner membrane translocase subunit TIM8 [Trametes pubescens]|uniref:Mitochondrial import inner membrane translocase subunit n=1 Tax=Trametes pubescens TaxID=154538 RepID=A0A1M2VYE8_TRAPU|nr:Mitochondrial import inner membrane translocase subunit TIM8 [Trametes pubescens]
MSDINDFNLDPASRKELESFIETQQAQGRVQAQVHMLTEMCWDNLAPHRARSRSAPAPISAPSRCVGSISSGFSRSEQSCLANCVDRFLDTSMYLVQKVEDRREAAQGQ